MSHLWLLLHVLGFPMWLGGGLAAMVAGLSGRKETRAGLGAVTRAQTSIQKMVVTPGALLVVFSGLILTIRLMNAMTTSLSSWLMVMQGAGILGALIILLGGLPIASRLSRLDPEGPHAAHFDELRRRQKVVASAAGVLAVVALVA
ncbi:MAG TPA: hypothetical protein VFK36_10530, partial [Gemmatimonadales bacterium]|nr:hypothetical protein [Gemmatimonadales bacterium]